MTETAQFKKEKHGYPCVTQIFFLKFGFSALLLPLLGIQGIVEAYRMVLPQIRLSGPTNFSPIINHVASIAASAAQVNAAAVSELITTKA